MDLYRDRPNVAVLRTFSKAYGLAGLRVGFLIGHEPVAEAVRKTMLPFTVSSVAQAAAVASLDAEANSLSAWRRSSRSATGCGGAARGRLDRAGTEANFVWLRLGEHTTAFAAACDAAGIAIRPFAGEGARDLDRHPAQPTMRSWRRAAPSRTHVAAWARSAG